MVRDRKLITNAFQNNLSKRPLDVAIEAFQFMLVLKHLLLIWLSSVTIKLYHLRFNQAAIIFICALGFLHPKAGHLFQEQRVTSKFCSEGEITGHWRWQIAKARKQPNKCSCKESQQLRRASQGWSCGFNLSYPSYGPIWKTNLQGFKKGRAHQVQQHRREQPWSNPKWQETNTFRICMFDETCNFHIAPQPLEIGVVPQHQHFTGISHKHRQAPDLGTKSSGTQIYGHDKYMH